MEPRELDQLANRNRTDMKIFISWSGNRSKYIASALSDLLPDFLQDIVTWMSQHDTDIGSRWNSGLNKALAECQFGIICLTPENLTSSWLLFEAGALSKSVEESRVIPYMFDLNTSNISYPLAQFQGVSADRDGTLELVMGINKLREPIMQEDRLQRNFDRVWPDLESKLDNIPEVTEGTGDIRSDREILEELLQFSRRDERIMAERMAYRFTTTHVPEDAIWKTLSDVNENDLKLMDTEELQQYIQAAQRRLSTTPYILGEYDNLKMKIKLATTEFMGRISEE